MKKIIIAIFTLALAACASAGNQSLKQVDETNVQNMIVEGQTTKDEIRTKFGSPFKTSFTDGGLEIWNYELSDVKADAVNYIPVVNMFGSSVSGHKKELVILFDENGIVKKFSMSKSKVAVKSGVFK